MNVEEKKQQSTPVPKTTVINADGLILGRMASVVAKRLLQGEKVVIVNAEKAIISGKPRSIINEYKDMLKKRTATNPSRGPLYPKMPDRLVRRTVRGMLPIKKPKGRNAYKRLSVYIGVPKKYENASLETVPQASSSKIKLFMKVGDLARELGWSNYMHA